MLKGDLNKFSPGDLLSFLSHLNQEGVLTVSRDDQCLNFSFQSGFLVAAHSEQADGKVLHALKTAGLITAEQFKTLDQARRETDLPLQQILRDTGTMDLSRAGAILADEIREVIFQLFTWEAGEFQFNEIPVEAAREDQVFDCTGFSLDAARQVDEYREFLRNINSADLIPALTAAGRQVTECSPAMRFLLDQATGERSVQQLMIDSPDTSFTAMKTIAEALQQDWILLRPSQAPAPIPEAALADEGKLFFSYKRSTLKVLQAQGQQEQIAELISYCRDHFDYFLLFAFKQNQVVRCLRFQRDQEGQRQGTELPKPTVGLESDPMFRFVCESSAPFFGKAFASPLLQGLGEPDPTGECAIIPLGGKGAENFVLFVSADQEAQVPGPLHYLEMVSWQIHQPRQENQVPPSVAKPAPNSAAPIAHQTASAADLVAAVRDLPPMPQVVSQVMELLSDPNSQMTDMVTVLSRDPALVARLIRVSNSALYGRGQETTSLGQAVVRLGNNTVRSLVVAASMKTLFPVDKTHVGIWGQALWLHSIESGLAARRVAQLTKYPDPEEAFVAGVLHDIGKVVILLNQPEKFRLVLKRQAAAKEDFVTAEHAVLGFDHTDVGELLLAKWQMPGNLQACVKHHHHPDAADGDSRLAHIVAAGNFLSHAHGSQPDADMTAQASAFELTCGALGLGSDQIQTLQNEIGSYLEQSGMLN